MDKKGRFKMTVELEVTVPQALALQAMFDYWNKLSAWGGSRVAGFYADGDGDFHPKAKCNFPQPIPELTEEMREAAACELKDMEFATEGDRYFDYDPIAWKLHGE